MFPISEEGYILARQKLLNNTYDLIIISNKLNSGGDLKWGLGNKSEDE